MAKLIKAPEFDNLEDVRSKFVNTMCYYKGKPILVKSAGFQEDKEGNFIPNKFVLSAAHFQDRSKAIKLEDPEFNYKDYNIGYANSAHYAIWWYRKPVKQYQQGLKKEQLSYVSSDPYMIIDDNFNFSRPYVAMLENDYPDLNFCEKVLKDGKTRIAAFHRDFALSWDVIHEDFVLEHRGRKVGASLNGSLKEFKLMADYKHLAEALMEVLG
jgi:hypothetical protein